VGHVLDALKKHQKEKPEAPEQPPAPPSGGKPAPPQGPKPAKQEEGPPSPEPGSGDNYASVLVAHHDRGGRLAEQYRALRTNILAQSPNERLCTIITSAEAGEGKTVTCLNLAVVLSERQERRTIVVDCDLRKSKIPALLGIRSDIGMADLLRGTATLKDVIQPTSRRNLSIIGAGRAEQDEIAGLIGQPEVEDLVQEIRKAYDYVLIDTPPINAVSDAGMLGRVVGQAMLIVRMNKTHRDSVDRAIRLLRAANVKPSGIVLTHQKYFIPKYLYRYS